MPAADPSMLAADSSNPTADFDILRYLFAGDIRHPVSDGPIRNRN
jgi:hypothetical protein